MIAPKPGVAEGAGDAEADGFCVTFVSGLIEGPGDGVSVEVGPDSWVGTEVGTAVDVAPGGTDDGAGVGVGDVK